MKNTERALNALLSWIGDHDQLYNDFLEHFGISVLNEDETEFSTDSDSAPHAVFDSVGDAFCFVVYMNH